MTSITMHDDEARAVIHAATGAVRRAEQLGRDAARLKMSRHHNPFSKVIGHEALSEAWLKGLFLTSNSAP